jgi:hypothetical protein
MSERISGFEFFTVASNFLLNDIFQVYGRCRFFRGYLTVVNDTIWKKADIEQQLMNTSSTEPTTAKSSNYLKLNVTFYYAFVAEWAFI